MGEGLKNTEICKGNKACIDWMQHYEEEIIRFCKRKYGVDPEIYPQAGVPEDPGYRLCVDSYVEKPDGLENFLKQKIEGPSASAPHNPKFYLYEVYDRTTLFLLRDKVADSTWEKYKLLGPSHSRFDRWTTAFLTEGKVDDWATAVAFQVRTRLTFASRRKQLQMQPGKTREFQIETSAFPSGFTPLPGISVTWSVDPQGLGVQIDNNGVITTSPSTPHGSVFTIAADVKITDKTTHRLTSKLTVYDPKKVPFVGCWQETARIDCKTGKEIPTPDTDLDYFVNSVRVLKGEKLGPDLEPIREFCLTAFNEANVTWHPFETYHDYEGSFTVSSDGSFRFVVNPNMSNYVPTDFDGIGRLAVEGGKLMLRDVWLGTPRHPKVAIEKSCGHVFEKPTK